MRMLSSMGFIPNHIPLHSFTASASTDPHNEISIWSCYRIPRLPHSRNWLSPRTMKIVHGHNCASQAENDVCRKVPAGAHARAASKRSKSTGVLSLFNPCTLCESPMVKHACITVPYVLVHVNTLTRDQKISTLPEPELAQKCEVLFHTSHTIRLQESDNRPL